MFIKRTVRRNGTMSEGEFRTVYIDTVKEMLGEIGVKDILEHKSGGTGIASSGYVPNFPKTCGKMVQYRQGSVNYDTNFYAGYIMQFSVDGVNYVLGYYDSSNSGGSYLGNEFTDMGKSDYYNSREGTNTNFLGSRSGSGTFTMFASDSSIFITLCRNEATKTFAIIVHSDKLSANRTVICHSGLTNSGPSANDDCLCLPHMNGTPSSRKDYGVTEEHFRMINPIGFYGGEAFDYVDNIDKIHNKAYIQKPLVAMYKRGIIGEVKGLYYATIKAPGIGDLVSMGGITYVYIGAGLYFKNEV